MSYQSNTRLCWAVVGNLSREPRRGKTPNKQYRGTPVFAPGAKLFLGEFYGGMAEKGHFVGQNRVSKKLSNSVVAIYAVKNLRAHGVYSPSLHSRLQKLGARLFQSKEEAVTWARHFDAISRARAAERAAANKRQERSKVQVNIAIRFGLMP